MAEGRGHDARRALICRALRTGEIGTQGELRKELARSGVRVTQATLSRDLAALKAARVTRRDGGTVYHLPQAKAAGGERLPSVAPLILSVDEADAMVVVRTLPGGASVVAAAIDASRPPGVLGTLAGDDTIFIVPAKGVPPGRLARALRGTWGQR